MKTPIGILFDKDGTLLDFNGSWLAAYEAAAEIIAEYSEGRCTAVEVLVHGGYIPEEKQWQPESVLAAGSSREILQSWNALLPKPLDSATVTRIDKIFHLAESTLVPAVQTLSTCLQQLKRAGYVLGIATMDSEKGARRMTAALEIEPEFDFICGADSGFGEKPLPGMVHAFSYATGIDVESVVMVGDSPRDIMMGVNAGAGLSVGVTSGAHGDAELRKYTQHVLPDIGYLHDHLTSVVDSLKVR